jgi:uncharacterized protein
MKLIALALFVTLSLAAAAGAQQSSTDNSAPKPATSASAPDASVDGPATKEDVAKYFEAMHSRELMEATLDKISVSVQAIMHEQLKSEKNLPPDLEARVAKATAETLHQFQVEDILNAIEPVIQKNYTQGELRAIVAFYSSPYGQSIQKKQPTVAAETLQAMSPLIAQAQAEAMRRVQEEIAKIRKEQEDVPKKS